MQYILYRRAIMPKVTTKEIVISVDGNQSKVWTTEDVVKNILEEANIEVTD